MKAKSQLDTLLNYVLSLTHPNFYPLCLSMPLSFEYYRKSTEKVLVLVTQAVHGFFGFTICISQLTYP